MKKKKRENKLKIYNENYNTHHLINRCRGWTSVEENTRETKVRLHNCLHALFWNETPAEAIKSLIDFFEPALMEWFKNDLLKVLRDWKWVEHKTKTYKWQRIRDWGIKDLLHKWTKNGQYKDIQKKNRFS